MVLFSMLKLFDYTTYFFRVRKGYNALRNSTISDHTSTKSEFKKINTSVITNPYDDITIDENKMHLKRDSRHTVADEELITDWIPEIPFWNVILTKFINLSLRRIR